MGGVRGATACVGCVCCTCVCCCCWACCWVCLFLVLARDVLPVLLLLLLLLLPPAPLLLLFPVGFSLPDEVPSEVPARRSRSSRRLLSFLPVHGTRGVRVSQLPRARSRLAQAHCAPQGCYLR